jgi:hypothetical protein
LGRVKKNHIEGLDLKRDIYAVRNHSLPAARAVTEFWNFMAEKTRVEHSLLPARPESNHLRHILSPR